MRILVESLGYEKCFTAAATLAALLAIVGSTSNAQQPTAQTDKRSQPVRDAPWQSTPDLAQTDWSLGNIRLPRLVQQPRAVGSLVADGTSDGMDLVELSTSASIIVPDLMFDSGTLFTVTPNFSVMNVEGPSGFDLPSELFRTGARLGWMYRSTERVSYNLGLTPNVSSDFETSDHAMRIMAHAMMNYGWRPDIQFLLGAVYLDRNDVSVLPVAGMVWTPSEDLRVEVTVPRPRIAHRAHVRRIGESLVEDWLYVAGEFGGGTWGVERAPGRTDELTFRDFRFVLGYESKSSGRIDRRAEIGYVFGRKVEYASDGAQFEPGDALLMRAGISY